jgi:hypothetical protein
MQRICPLLSRSKTFGRRLFCSAIQKKPNDIPGSVIAYGICAVPTGFYVAGQSLSEFDDGSLCAAVILGIPISLFAGLIGGCAFPVTWFLAWRHK